MRRLDFANSAALLVGVATYSKAKGPQRKEFDNVPNALNNLNRLRRILSPGGRRGFPTERLHTLSDPTDGNGIRDTLEAVAEQATDILLFYYVGHGWKIEEELYLASKTSDRKSIENNGLRYKTVRRIMRESPAAVRIVILDCCFSGVATTGTLGADSGIMLTKDDVPLPLSDHAEGVCLISSSGPEEPSSDSDGAGYTAFTGHFLDALEAGAASGEHELGVVFRATAARMAKAGLGHKPLIAVQGDAHRLVLAGGGPTPEDTAPVLAPLPAVGSTRVKWEGPWGAWEFPDSESAVPVLRLFLEAGWHDLRRDHDGG